MAQIDYFTGHACSVNQCAKKVLLYTNMKVCPNVKCVEGDKDSILKSCTSTVNMSTSRVLSMLASSALYVCN